MAAPPLFGPGGGASFGDLVRKLTPVTLASGRAKLFSNLVSTFAPPFITRGTRPVLPARATSGDEAADIKFRKENRAAALSSSSGGPRSLAKMQMIGSENAHRRYGH